ncbi:unnamed protein product, partial [Didymodactylos carnosus]
SGVGFEEHGIRVHRAWNVGDDKLIKRRLLDIPKAIGHLQCQPCSSKSQLSFIRPVSKERKALSDRSSITPGSDNNSGESDDECFFPMPTAAFDQPDMLPEMNLKDYFPDGNDNVHDVVYNADYENESPLLYTMRI